MLQDFYCTPFPGDKACSSASTADRCHREDTFANCMAACEGSCKGVSYDPKRKWCIACSQVDQLHHHASTDTTSWATAVPGRHYAVEESTLCDSSTGPAWIVNQSSGTFPSHCSGYSLKEGKCRFATGTASECQAICDGLDACSGFTINESGCYFRSFPLDVIMAPSANNTCYRKRGESPSACLDRERRVC